MEEPRPCCLMGPAVAPGGMIGPGSRKSSRPPGWCCLVEERRAAAVSIQGRALMGASWWPAWWCCSLGPGGWKSRSPVALVGAWSRGGVASFCPAAEAVKRPGPRPQVGCLIEEQRAAAASIQGTRPAVGPPWLEPVAAYCVRHYNRHYVGFFVCFWAIILLLLSGRVGVQNHKPQSGKGRWPNCFAPV